MNALNDIIERTEQHFGLAPGSIYGRCRTATVSKARHVAAYLARTTTDYSYPEIADHFHKDHTTIIYSINTVKKNWKRYENDIKHILPTRIIRL